MNEEVIACEMARLWTLGQTGGQFLILARSLAWHILLYSLEGMNLGFSSWPCPNWLCNHSYTDTSPVQHNFLQDQLLQTNQQQPKEHRF